MPFPSPEHQFRPGTSGNPGGRPKGRSILATVRELIEQTTDLDESPPPELTIRERLARVWLKLGLGGDAKAIKDLVTYLEGRPRQATPESGDTTVRDAALERLRRIHETDGGNDQ